MRSIAVTTAVLILFCERALSQRNSPSERQLFRLPQGQLRSQEYETKTQVAMNSREPQFLPTGASARSTEQLFLSRSSADKDREWYRRLERGGYLTNREAPANWFVRWTDAIFQPEAVRIGKTSVSCSIVTAIKRKNPLCLINPIVFDMSW